MFLIKKILLFLIFISLSLSVLAQSRAFNEKILLAKRNMRAGNNEIAEKLLFQCYKIDSSNVVLLKSMLELSASQEKWTRLSIIAQKLQKLDPNNSEDYKYKESLAYFYNQEFTKAEKGIKNCLNFKNIDVLKRQKYTALLTNINFTQEAIKNPVPFEPINLGAQINSQDAEYLPNLTQDGNYLIFTRMTAASKAFPSLQEDFYVSKNENNAWLKAMPLTNKINTVRNEGAPSISADGTVLYFAACERKDGAGSCDIYYSFNRGNYWTTPKNLRAVNTEYWESQPNLSADGRHLFFTSNRPGGYGAKDIWAIDVDVDGTWGKVYNLGERINTSQNEISPFLHFDNKTLYFASDGWPGMGSKDIFVSRKQSNGKWSEPENLGYPINSQETDNSFFVNTSGETAYFSSERKGGYGKEDIYKFSLYPKIRPQKAGYYKSVILDAKTHKIINAKYEIRNINDSSDVYLKETKSGHISLGLEANNKYIISAFADGYLYYSSYIDSIIEDSLSVIEDKIYLTPIAKNEQFELKNIEFEFDKASLRKSSTKELDLFANYLNSNPEIIILIEGHTDNKGNLQYNLKLSQERADAVKKYLLSRTLSEKQIQTKGFGSTQMLYNEENKQDKNRRVVIRIIED